MIKEIAWNTFKKTGDINTFLEFKEIQNIEANIDIEKDINKVEQNGNIQNKGNYHFGTQYERL